MTYSKIIACLSVTTLAAGLLIGCGSAKTTTSSTESVLPEVTSEALSEITSSESTISEVSSGESAASEADSFVPGAETVVFASSDGKEKIEIPKTWADLTGKIDATGGIGQSYPLQVGSFDEAAFLISNGEPKEGSSITSLDDYYKVLHDYIPVDGHVFQGVQNITEIPARTLEKSGFTAREFTFTANVLSGAEDAAAQGTGTTSSQSTQASGEAAVFHIVAVEGAGSYYQFCGWTSADSADAFAREFEAVLDSFMEAS